MLSCVFEKYFVLYFKNNCLTAKNSREWSVKANVGMPPNLMTQNTFSEFIKRICMFNLNNFQKNIQNINSGSEDQFFDPF